MLSDETCYVVKYDQLVAAKFMLLLSLKFDDPVFMHAFTLAQDMKNGGSYSHTNNYELL